MSERVLVTGGRGVLGSELVPRLQQSGYHVRITSRKARPHDAAPDLEWAPA
jgi:nucleoside-diphosphate-sugar epimerase